MKPLWKYCLAAIVLFGAAACSKDDPPPSGGEGSISIRIAGDPVENQSRATLTGGEAEDESKVTTYNIYVFHYDSGQLEKMVVGDPSYTTVITGLTMTTTKRIYVVANYPSMKTITQYSDLMDDVVSAVPMGVISTVEANGMVMVGEAEEEVVLSTTETVRVPVHLKRLLAKITLGTVTLSGDADPSKFVLEGVGIQGVFFYSNLGFGPFDFEPSLGMLIWVGGYAGTNTNAPLSQFADPISFPDSPAVLNKIYTFNNYFYMPRNDNTARPPIICLKATYDGTPYYYPLVVNGTVSNTGGSNTDGTLVKSNHQYRVNITIKDPIGTNDPDTPIEMAGIEIVTTMEAWALPINQDVEL